MPLNPLDIRLILRTRLRHWQNLPLALKQLQASPLAQHMPEGIKRHLAALENQGWQDLEALRATSQALEETVPKLRQGSTEAQALADLFHATLEQDLPIACEGFFQDSELWRDLLPEFKLPAESPQVLEQLLQALDGIPLQFQPPTLNIKTLTGGKNACEIWVIENNPHWQKDILELLELLQTQLPRLKLSWQFFDHAQALLSALPQFQKKGKQKMATFQLVIADLGIAQTPEGPESRQIGLNLIHTLRNYQINLPVVVLTSPAHLPGDQQRLAQAGIAPSDYILKSGHAPLFQMRDSLLRLLQKASSHQILIEADKTTFSVDQLPLNLTDFSQKVFFALAELSAASGPSTYFSATDILHKVYPQFQIDADEYWLKAVLKRYPDLSGPATHLAMPKNIMRIWNTLIAEYGSQPEIALSEFKKNYVTLWRDCEGLSSKKINVQWMNQHWGGVPLPKSGKPKQIHDAVLQIRKSLHKTFSRAGRWVDVGAEILVHQGGEGISQGYRLQGEISLPQVSPKRPHRRRWNVLALENQILRQQRLQALFHESAHFKLELAASIQSGISAFEKTPFDALLLDLHLPDNDQLWKKDPTSGRSDGGIIALQAILATHHSRQSQDPALPDLPILVPTQFNNREDLRQLLAQMGVSPDSIIPCDRGGLWEAHLMLNLERLRQAWELRQILPLYERWQCPQVKVLKSSPKALLLNVNGQEISYKGNQARMLGLLLQKPGQWVSIKSLEKQVYPDQAVPANGIKQLAKNLHASIREKWLPGTLPEGQSPQKAALWLLEHQSVSTPGYCLHAWVQP